MLTEEVAGALRAEQGIALIALPVGICIKWTDKK
jgi:hypothetical protein